MKALDDALHIGHGFRDATTGEKLEPEEQPVDRVIRAPLPVTLGNAPGEGKAIDLTMRGDVRAETTAGEVLDSFTEQCQFCAHWDQPCYQRERVKYDRDELNEQRAHVLELASPEDIADATRAKVDFADAILDASMGRCQALGHLVPDGRLDTHARAFCPAADPRGNPVPKGFQARRDAKRTVASIRDRILRTAAGKE